MIDGVMTVVLVATTLGAGLIAGTFFTFSTFVMAALARRPRAEGMAAMQAINITVLNPWFLGTFIGTAIGATVLAIYGLAGIGPVNTLYLLTGGVLYVVGCFGVTGACNVPLNKKLAVLDPASADGQAFWDDYQRRWVMWNHIRTVASMLAALAYMIAMGNLAG